jgi:hypothetical protein
MKNAHCIGGAAARHAPSRAEECLSAARAARDVAHALQAGSHAAESRRWSRRRAAMAAEQLRERASTARVCNASVARQTTSCSVARGRMFERGARRVMSRTHCQAGWHAAESRRWSRRRAAMAAAQLRERASTARVCNASVARQTTSPSRAEECLSARAARDVAHALQAGWRPAESRRWSWWRAAMAAAQLRERASTALVCNASVARQTTSCAVARGRMFERGASHDVAHALSTGGLRRVDARRIFCRRGSHSRCISAAPDNS